MAAAGAPFSIREYVARARGQGGGWPFGGEAGALPPVQVRRFRWWEDEAAAVDEEEGEVERRMAAKRRKRSVAELFAAVPRVARGQGCGKGKASKRKLEKGKAVLTVSVKVSKGSKMTEKKKKKIPAGIDVKEKEKSNGVKATSIGISQSFHHSIRKRKPKNNISKKKRNQEVSVLLDKKSKKGKGKPVLDRYKKAIVNSGEAESIFKKHSKTGFSPAPDNTDIRFKSNSSCKSKHVTFSDGNGIFRWTTHVPENNTEQPQLAQMSQRPALESHDHLSTDEQQLAYQQADAISGAVENASSLSENVASAGVHHTVPLTKLKGKTISGKSVDLNHCIETSNISNCMNSISLASLSSKVPCENFNGVGSHMDGADGLNVECIGEQNHMISQASVNPFSLAAKAISGDRSPLSQPSSSCLYDMRRSTLRESLIANYHLGKVRPELLRSGKDVVRTINSSTGSNKSAGAQQATDCVSACRNMHFSDDYVGLPINSRGEFIKVHPGGTPNSVDTFKRQCLGENSLRPSAFPTIFTPSTCTDRVNLRLHNHHARQVYTVDHSVFHADPRFTPTAPMATGMGFRQLPNSERTNIHCYTIPSNKYPCTNQQELSVVCFCSGCMGHHNPQQKLLGMQNRCLRQNHGQSTRHNAETTMRLMGTTVTLGTSTAQCRDLSNGTPYSSKQTRAEDQFFQGTHTKVFPQLFHGGLVDPTSACRISVGDKQPSGKTSHFSFVPAAESSFVLDTSRFKTNGHNQQPGLATTNNPYAHPVGRSNEGDLGHQQPVMANQDHGNADDLPLGSMPGRQTQTVAPESSFNTRNVRNFMEKRPALYQSSYLTQQFSNTTQRTLAPSFVSSYAVQKAPSLTKFTSLRPLPPSVVPYHVYSADYAPPLGSVTTFHPSIPIPYQPCNSGAPVNAIFKDESMRGTMMGPKPEGLEHLRNCKRPAEQDDALLPVPKKPCTAVRKELNMLPFPEKGLEFHGCRPDVQPRDMPVCLDHVPEADLRLGSRESQPTWSNAINTMRPVRLNPGANDALQPSASSVHQENPWPAHPVTPSPFAVEDPSCTASSSKARDTEIYES